MLVLSMLACSSIDAPEALEDLMVYGLLNFEDRRSREPFTERAVTELSAYEDAL